MARANGPGPRWVLYLRPAGADRRPRIRGADPIVPELQQLAVGDTVNLAAVGGPKVVLLDPGRALVLFETMDLRTGQSLPSVPPTPWAMDWTWAFTLRPTRDGATRCADSDAWRLSAARSSGADHGAAPRAHPFRHGARHAARHQAARRTRRRRTRSRPGRDREPSLINLGRREPRSWSAATSDG
jgi:hypothetical protein